MVRLTRISTSALSPIPTKTKQKFFKAMFAQEQIGVWTVATKSIKHTNNGNRFIGLEHLLLSWQGECKGAFNFVL